MEGIAEETEGEATPQLGAPYVTYGIQNKQHSIMLFARMGGAEVLRYKQVGGVVGRTKETLRTTDICTRPIILPQLRRHVAAWGTKWPSAGTLHALPGRTARGMEWRWSSLVAQGRSLETASTGGTSGVTEHRVPPCAGQETSDAGGTQGPGPARGAAQRCKGAKGSTMEPLRLGEVAVEARGNRRRLGHGRGWTAALETPAEGSRGMAPRDAAKMREWGVSGSGTPAGRTEGGGRSSRALHGSKRRPHRCRRRYRTTTTIYFTRLSHHRRRLTHYHHRRLRRLRRRLPCRRSPRLDSQRGGAGAGRRRRYGHGEPGRGYSGR